MLLTWARHRPVTFVLPSAARALGQYLTAPSSGPAWRCWTRRSSDVALPRIGRDLDADLAALQWTVNAYMLTLAGLILLGGALGDRFGRRKVFVVGVVWFAAASLLCGLAPNAGVLIAARALQGVGGALLTPGSLALIQASFHPDDRARAVGLWSGFGGIGAAVGPFLGGWLVDGPGWRWVFLLNVPAGPALRPGRRCATYRSRGTAAGARPRLRHARRGARRASPWPW